MIKEQMDIENQSDSDEDGMPVFAAETNMLKGKKIDNLYPDVLNNYEYKNQGFDEISEEEKEDYTIKKSDAIIVGAKIQGDYSTLEIYVYEEEKCNLYVHHEIVLSAFPLCMEFLPIDPFNYTTD